jgi:dTDP-4-dehydrorhamnose reductase
VPVDRKGDYGAVRRPANSVLDNTRARALGIVLPHWKDDLACYLQRRAKVA